MPEIAIYAWNLFLFVHGFTLTISSSDFSCSLNLKCNHAFTLFTVTQPEKKEVIFMLTCNECMQFMCPPLSFYKTFFHVNSSDFYLKGVKWKKIELLPKINSHARHVNLIKIHSQKYIFALVANIRLVKKQREKCLHQQCSTLCFNLNFPFHC